MSIKPCPITITTYNIHKGMSALNRTVQINDMAEALQTLQSDILFLQEVQGENLSRQLKYTDFPSQPHYEIISDYLSFNSSYGKNAIYPQKHHGNAILSRLAIKTCHNLDISVNKREHRGMLHCEITPEGWPIPLVCLCTHLNLFEPDRIKQYQIIFEYINQHISPESPLIIAGDFNDWRQTSCLSLGNTLNLDEVFVNNHGKRPRTFPARLPILSLDRIYTRHLHILETKTHCDKLWQSLSDHLPLTAKLIPK